MALAAAAPRGVDARILTRSRRRRCCSRDAAALGRLDVADGLDGVEDGLWALGSLAARGVRVLNRAGALLAAHDKLLTARVLQRAGLPHPRTRILHPGGHVPDWDGPVVVKPRFGSWGRDVELCEDEIAFRRHLRALEHRLWFQRHGARPAGARPARRVRPPHRRRRRRAASARSRGSRRPASGGRTSRSAERASRSSRRPRRSSSPFGPRRRPAPTWSASTCFPDGDGGHTVLELNGAVDFTREYRLDRDPFVAAAASSPAPRPSRRRAGNRAGSPRPPTARS